MADEFGHFNTLALPQKSGAPAKITNRKTDSIFYYAKIGRHSPKSGDHFPSAGCILGALNMVRQMADYDIEPHEASSSREDGISECKKVPCAMGFDWGTGFAPYRGS